MPEKLQIYFKISKNREYILNNIINLFFHTLLIYMSHSIINTRDINLLFRERMKNPVNDQ